MMTMKRVARASIIPLTLAGLVAVGWWLVHDAKFAVLDPSGDIALQQRRILFFVTSLAAVVVIPVFIMLVTFMWRYQEGKKGSKYDPEWQDNKWLEIVWWGIPIAIVASLAVVTWTSSHQLDPYRAIESDNETVKVQVVALQWKWLFIYPDYGIATVNHLPIPEKTPIHFTLAADAPMSAFWIPSLGSQIYVMNGMTSQLNLIANETGIYEGYNTNINGEGYSSMRFSVESMGATKFMEWVDRSRLSSPLDTVAYEKLATIGVQRQKEVYRSVNDELFDQIVVKYMHHHGAPIDSIEHEHNQDHVSEGHDMDSMRHTDHSMHEGGH